MNTLQQTLLQVFEKNRGLADRIAVDYAGVTMSYDDLDRKSDAIANYIFEQSYPKGTNIGVLTENKWELIYTLVGILKAGCVFMPLDSAYPAERIYSMLSSTETSAVFVDQANRGLLDHIALAKDYTIYKLDINGVQEEKSFTASSSPSSSEHSYHPDDPIYVYFTSGTTGNPKGILGRNGSLLHFIEWEIRTLGLTEGTRVSQLTSQCHDPYLRDILVPLCVSGTICIPDGRETLLSTQKLVKWLDDAKVHLVHCTPSMFKILHHSTLTKSNFEHLTHILLAGERVVPKDLRRWYDIFDERIALINLYGPTETTLAKLYYPIQPQDAGRRNIPVGSPIEGCRVVILDQSLNICSQGTVGEIIIRTPYRSLGYVSQQQLNQERFIPNPFSNDPTDLVYRTGDLGRMLPDGHIELVGRVDRQVKIRGYRIEPEEVEIFLLQHEQIAQAAVVYLEDEDEGEGNLVAYYTPNGEASQHASDDIKTHLSVHLPDYMIPKLLVQLEEMPLNSNGKINYAALPEPDFDLSSDYQPPLTDLQKQLESIWCDILNTQRIGLGKSFLESGAHSLHVMSLIAKVYENFGIELPLGEAFQSTIEEMADFVQAVAITEEVEEELSIGRAPALEYYPATPTQKRIYVSDQMVEGTGYHIPVVWEVEGEIKLERLEYAFQRLIQRHEILRTTFGMVDDEPVQYVHSSIDFNVEHITIDRSIEEEMQSIIRPFDLHKAPLIRVTWVEAPENRSYLVFDMHHIITDGLSMNILAKEFSALFLSIPLEESKIQYKDYAVWLSKQVESKSLKKQEQYWMQRLEGDTAQLTIQPDAPRTSRRSMAGERLHFAMDKDIVCGLYKLASQNQVTLYMVLLSAFYVLLRKYTGQSTLAIGTPVSGRSHTSVAPVIGPFINTLVMKSDINGDMTIQEVLDRVKQDVIEAFENQDYPFERLVDQMRIQRDLWSHPLFQMMFMLDQDEAETINLGDMKLTPSTFTKSDTKFDMMFIMKESKENENISFVIEYSSELYTQKTVHQLGRHFYHIMRMIVNQPDCRISDIELLSEEDKRTLIQNFNGTEASFERRTIHELFEEQVEHTPDSTAVMFQDVHWSYKILNERANQIAAMLRASGMQAGGIVGLHMNRSLYLPASMLGILKAGGAYMPIDLDYPEERKLHMLQESCVEIVIALPGTPELKGYGGKILYLDQEVLDGYPQQNMSLPVSPDALAYVIYTSGSTGKPKGVMIEHASISNRLGWMQKRYPIGANDVILQKTPFTFDVSVWELFWPLLQGAKMYLLHSGGEKDPEEIAGAIAQHKVSVLHFVPSMLTVFLDLLDNMPDTEKQLNSLRHVFCSGEALYRKQVDRFYKHADPKQCLLSNLYGPTEATIDVTYYDCLPEDTGPVYIGKPIDNTELYILDADEHLQPPGVVGELCISGVGLARGYIHQQQLTQERFVTNPMRPEQLLYRTGDLARWSMDGNVEYIGRADHQVKIRGNRIELGEIECCALNHPDVQQAVVLGVETTGSELALTIYAVSQTLEPMELKQYLKSKLPSYMVPQYVIILPEMPITSNGKLDRKRLPSVDEYIQGETKSYVPPSNDVERRLADIYYDMLGIEAGINDNFFDLGGHSLKANALVGRIEKEFSVKLPLRSIFEHPTIREQGKCIMEQSKSAFSEIPINEMKHYPVSSAQRRLLILERLDEDNLLYNMPSAVRIEGELNWEQMQRSVEMLMNRHDSLRTSFADLEEEPVQIVHPVLSPPLYWEEVEKWEVGNKLLNWIRPFDLTKAPLFRIVYLKVNTAAHGYLLIDVHHTLSDGISSQILIRELAQLYTGDLLESVPVQYKDYAVWHNKLLESGLKEQEDYWRHLFADGIPVLDFPTDYVRPAVKGTHGQRVSRQVPSTIAQGIDAIAKKEQATPFMVLLAAFHLLLAKYSGESDIVIGSPIAGRNHPDVQNTVGNFTNMLSLRNRFSPEERFLTFLQRIKENTLQAYEYGDYPFEKLVEALSVPRDPSRNPMFDFVLTMLNMDFANIHLNDLVLSPYDLEHSISKFDLMLTVKEHDNNLHFEFEYRSDLFKSFTIERLAEHFLNLLDVVTQNPLTPIMDIEFLSSEEKNLLEHGFNETQMNYPKHDTIHQSFEVVAARWPDRIAVIDGAKKLTYRDLDERSNQMANSLRSRGVQPGEIVGIRMNRSSELIVGILGILKSGGAYLPIDPNYPEERQHYMLKDCSARILVTDVSDDDKYDSVPEGIDSISTHSTEVREQNKVSPRNITSSSELAYIIYTSGSTGKPKGVLIEHSHVIRLLLPDNPLFHFSEKDVWTVFHSFSFDFSVWEMFGALLYGGSCVIVHTEVAQDPTLFLELVMREQVTVVNQTPGAFQNMLTTNPYVHRDHLFIRYVIFGGEELKPYLLLEWKRNFPQVKLVNMYGITEATVHVTYKEIEEEDCLASLSNIGRPIPTSTVYLLDSKKKLAPIGAVGEIYVGGKGVARGYQNNPSLTEERFIVNPFDPSDRLYRSGDLAKRLPTGELIYLGRIDQQVQIRGYRIELPEIEYRLTMFDEINEAVVIPVAPEGGQPILYAFFTANREVTPQEIRGFMQSHLPAYMVPSLYIQLENIPQTINGKVDRKKLELLTSSVVEARGEEPQNDMERKLLDIWRKLLSIDSIGVDQNFFEIGGDSSSLIRMRHQIQEHFSLPIPVVDLFSHPTISALAEYLAARSNTTYSVKSLTLPEHYFHVDQRWIQEEVLQYRFQTDKVRILNDMAHRAKVSLETLCLSLYLLLLYKETNSELLEIYTSLAGDGKIYPLSIEMKGIDHFDRLVEEAEKIMQAMSDHQGLIPEQLVSDVNRLHSFNMTPFMVTEASNDSGVDWKVCDWLFQISGNRDVVQFALRFNAGKFMKHSVAEFMNGLIDVTNQVTDYYIKKG